MSTELGIIADMNKDGILSLNQFSGGIEKGICIQLTIQTSEGWQFIHIDKMGATDLADLLVAWLEEQDESD